VKLAVLIFSLCLLSVPACAEPDAARFLRDYDAAADKRPLLAYVNGIESGMGWINATLVNQHDQPVYCSPRNLGLTADQLVDIIRKQVESTPSLATSPVGLTLLFGLKDDFPCPPKSN
jgi:hypothetical protein